jgi:hypothetical protein
MNPLEISSRANYLARRANIKAEYRIEYANICRALENLKQKRDTQLSEAARQWDADKLALRRKREAAQAERDRKYFEAESRRQKDPEPKPCISCGGMMYPGSDNRGAWRNKKFCCFRCPRSKGKHHTPSDEMEGYIWGCSLDQNRPSSPLRKIRLP